LVDDEEDVLKGLTKILEYLEYTVKCTLDGIEAREEVESRELDLVVSDIRMPRMDGIELARFIRKEEPGLPIILISGFADRIVTQRAEKEGVLGVLHRSLETDRLLDTIAQLDEELKCSSGGSEIMVLGRFTVQEPWGIPPGTGTCGGDFASGV
jgi:CheY-like chemotaxis protein